MKPTARSLILVVLAVLLISLACRMGPFGAKTAPSATPGSGGQAGGQTGAQAANTAAPVSANSTGSGQFTLKTPSSGLDKLPAYRQDFTGTIKGTYQGQPYDYSETVVRLVSGADETDQIDASTNSQVLSLFNARLGNVLYSQQASAQTCQAGTAEGKTPGTNLALKLPPVRNAAFSQNESLNGTAAALYTFDQKSVPNQAGQNGTASGKLWMDPVSGVVLKYELTVQVNDGDFSGEQTWSYTLQPGEVSLALPEGCQPVLASFPTLPGAQDVQNQPGFMTYTVSSTLAEARKFYLSALPAAGWEPLPTTSAQTDASETYNPTVMTFTRANADGSGQGVVVQISDQSGTLTVVAQTFRTQTAVQASESSASQPTVETGDAADEVTQEPSVQTGQAGLPDDFPTYPGGQMVTQTAAIRMITTSDSQDQVTEYYSSTLANAGWEKTLENNAGGTVMQTWQKDGLSVMVTSTVTGGTTRVVIMTMPK
jgi:hypothetical protein